MVIDLLLQRLGLYGFKSFAEKTDIEFGKGITAIVGPNGSGKSNITDAIRWVLGEQSIRNLRGAKLEDVIFAGSSSRRQSGIAEVSLTFDNSDHLLPIDYNEVTITRRVFRSGDSEYYINKTPCRLKDIHELLADTGLGRDSMTVISQNKIDEVLNSRPEERRLLFEEAAGITKYKQRKKDALRKLDDTNQNLTRVADILAEIKTQLGPLAESAAKTARYNELYANFVVCKASLLLDRLTKSERMIESAQHEKQTLADQELTISTALNLKETEEEGLRSEISKTDEKISSLQAEINKTSTELERLDGQTAVLHERISQAESSQERVREDHDNTAKELASVKEKLIQTTKTYQEKQQEIQILENLLRVEMQKYDEIVRQIRSCERQVEAGKDKTFDYIQELVTERNLLTSLERELVKLNNLKTSFLSEQNEYRIQLKAAEAELAGVSTEAATLAEAIKDNDSRQLKLAADKAVCEKELDKLLCHERQLIDLLNEHRSRLKVLTHMQQELEGFSRGIKSVLKSTATWRSGICGAVTQVIDVAPEYITAIEIALGGALQNIITDDEKTAKQAINYLKENKLGRATFLPINTIRPLPRRDYENIAANSPGVVGFAASLVNCNQKYRKIIDYLLGRTIIALDVDAAYSIAKKSGFLVKIVTLDGEVINPGGSMTGGAVNKRDASFLSRNRDIEQLQAQISAIEQNLQQLRKQTSYIQQKVVLLSGKIKSALDYKQQSEVRQAELAVYRDKINADISRLKLAEQTLTTELTDCDNESAEIQRKITETKEKITGLENRDLTHKQMIEELRVKLTELNKLKEDLSSSLTEQKVKLSALQQNEAAIKDTKKQFTEHAEALTLKLDNLMEEQYKLMNQITVARGELNAIEKSRQQLCDRKTLIETDYKVNYNAKLELVMAVQKLEKELKNLRREHTELKNRLHEFELINTKYSYELTRCLDELREQYNLTREAAEKLYRADDPSQLAKEAKLLETEIAALGSINPGAIDEYRKIEERRRFLETQYDDLVAAKEYLASIISEIDETMGSQFIEAFNKINKYFGDIFVKMFGGGMAQIKLSSPENLLETGIEVIVQPPGKKLQNLVLLSGGERALTVIALLFAFLSYRPSPFVVVDEIDAPLDEANLRRFSTFLRDYSINTQFIVVTHRKGTMEAADVMHGVTMEEAGISRLVSVKFNEKAS